jgi:hypothetical protein
MQLMHLMVKLREVGDVLRVGLQDIRRLQALDAVSDDIGQLVLEEEHSLMLVAAAQLMLVHLQSEIKLQQSMNLHLKIVTKLFMQKFQQA